MAEIIEEATNKLEADLFEARRAARRAGRKAIPEDDKEAYAAALRKATLLLFAEYHKRRTDLEDNLQKATKREAKEESEASKKRKMDAKAAAKQSKGKKPKGKGLFAKR